MSPEPKNQTGCIQVRPKVTWRGIGLTALFGLLYTLLNTTIIAGTNDASFINIFIGELLSTFILSIYMVPVWLLLVREFHEMKGGYILLLHAGLGALVSYLWYHSFVWVFGLIFNIEWLGDAFFDNRYWIMLSTFLIYAVVFSVIHIMYSIRRKRQDERRIARWKEHSRQLELANLKAQLNPHFLFNTLNSINAYVTKDPNETRRMIVLLADMLRYSLDSFEKESIRLEEELNFINTYLSLEKKRLGERLTYQIHQDPGLHDVPVPPMIIQPMVENAIKHGINSTHKAGKIDVKIEQKNGMLKVSVSDTGRGINPDEALSSDGIGLRNTNEVLTNKYGNKSRLQFSETPGGGACIYFYVPLD